MRICAGNQTGISTAQKEELVEACAEDVERMNLNLPF